MQSSPARRGGYMQIQAIGEIAVVVVIGSHRWLAGPGE
jgi:hypothetical protein